MTATIIDRAILRNDPFFEIIIYKDSFEIKDEKDKDATGIYSFTQLKNIEVKKAQTFWLSTIFFTVIDFIIGTSATGIMKLKDRICMSHMNREIVILLDNCDVNKAKQLVLKIRNAKV
ncbi:MAG: hypothetical protein NWQ38_06915 [Cellulophaga sp.]|nr:hypothetical protein [Cellulophaga sp.]